MYLTQKNKIGGFNQKQNLTLETLYSLRQKIQGLCEWYTIEYREQKTSYTSKASYLDGDKIPLYNTDNRIKYAFSSKGFQGGLYRSHDGHLN